METTGFVGLGQMGLAMASNLQKAGYALRVYNRTADKTRALVEQGAVVAESPAEVAQPGGIVITMLTDDRAVEEVTWGPQGFGPHLGQGGIHVSMSTISPDMARTLAHLHAQQGGHYVAAPVFGKPDAAAAAKLWIISSGPAAAKERVRPVLTAMGQGIYDFGEDAGGANVVKLSGNFLLGAAVEAMAEAFTLAEKNGLERQKVYELFSQTLFACPVYVNYGKLVASEVYQPVGAPPALIRKDMKLVLDTARNRNVPMPLASLIHDRLTATIAKGRDDIDWAGFAQEVSESAGVTRERR
jgi:3-hydroxyisobutyrate dehydrogenase-like beta-hydroxyacid dehydrogenase